MCIRDSWKKAIAELRTLDNNLLMLAEGGKTSLMNNGFNLLYGDVYKRQIPSLGIEKPSLGKKLSLSSFVF